MKKLLLFLAFICFTIHLQADDREITLIASPYYQRQIEILIAKPSKIDDRLLIFLHGASEDGLRSISSSWIDHWISKGYAVAAISMPGFGGSTGYKDFCGPATLTSLNFAIDHIKNRLLIKDLGMIGFGQGALAATLLTTQRDDIRCLVSANGAYDLFRHQKRNDPLLKILKEKYYLDLGKDSSFKCRSPLLHISKMNTPLFILHRRGNPIISENEAQDFYEAMLKCGKECFLVIKDKTPNVDSQKLSYEEILTETETWVDNRMGLNKNPAIKK